MATDPRSRSRRNPAARGRPRAPHPRVREPEPLVDEPLVEEPVAYEAAPPPSPGGWRDAVAVLSGLNVLAGIWLIIAPWVLNYNVADPKWNDVVFGAIVGIFALVRITGAYREAWLSWLNAAIGVWLFIAAFTIDNSWTAGWNDIILGVIVFVLGIGSASASEEGTAAV